jgi:hypothetical protein
MTTTAETWRLKHCKKLVAAHVRLTPTALLYTRSPPTSPGTHHPPPLVSTVAFHAAVLRLH